MSCFGYPKQGLASDQSCHSCASGFRVGETPRETPIISNRTFEEALRALPIHVELSTASGGVVFSNREGLVHSEASRARPPQAIVTLSGGITLSYCQWVDSVAVVPKDTHAHITNNSGPLFPVPVDNVRNIDLESIPIPAWKFDVDNGALTTLQVNAQWALFIGVPPGYISPEVWRDAVHPDDAVRVSENWKRAIASGCEYTSEVRLCRGADGEYIWFRGRAQPLRNSKGVVVAFLGVT